MSSDRKGLADEVASRIGIEHESPQVIVLRNGQPVYSASLWDISGEEWRALLEPPRRAGNRDGSAPTKGRPRQGVGGPSQQPAQQPCHWSASCLLRAAARGR
jgi:hypothetical protein